MDHRLLLQSCAQHLNEGRQRLHFCLGQLAELQVWHRPNAHTVSVGNLVLHLCGNIHQWITTTLGGAPDIRQRDLEFSTSGPLPTAALLEHLDSSMDRALVVLHALDDEALSRTYQVQGFAPTGVGVLVHVTEHFSYHVGQVTLHTKLLLDMDTGYYAGHRL